MSLVGTGTEKVRRYGLTTPDAEEDCDVNEGIASDNNLEDLSKF